MAANTVPISICLACGGRKDDPVGTCGHCGHTPETKRDRAKHLLIRARELSESEAVAVSAGIAAGQELEFGADALLTMEAALAANKPDPHWLLLWCSVLGVPGIALLIWWLLN